MKHNYFSLIKPEVFEDKSKIFNMNQSEPDLNSESDLIED